MKEIEDRLDSMVLIFLCILMVSILINIGLIVKTIKIAPACEEVYDGGS